MVFIVEPADMYEDLPAPSFGQWLRDIRWARDLRQHELAAKLDFTESLVRGVESGRLRPSKAFARAVATYLQLDPSRCDEFVEWARGMLSLEHSPTLRPVLTRLAQAPILRSSTHLPRPLGPLFGRDADIEHVHALLLDGGVRLVSLTGAPGVGKTRLALAVAAACRRDFRDGVNFVTLELARDAGAALSAVARSLRVEHLAGRRFLDGVIAGLRNQRLLLVLDNFEHVISASGWLSELLQRLPSLKILVTSRERTGLSFEGVVAVRPLELAPRDATKAPDDLLAVPSVALFVARAQAINRAFALRQENARAIVEICHRLDGLPLAIELVAPHTLALSPHELSRRLRAHGSLRLLSTGGRDRPARQRTLRAAVEWSYERLEGTLKQLFASLSAFAGGWTLDAAEAVGQAAGATVEDVLPGLEALLDKSLIRQQAEDTSTRFFMLETIREFASEVLGNDRAQVSAADVHRAHADYFARFAERAEEHLVGAQQHVWMDRLAIEHDNLHAALEWAYRQRDQTTLMRVAGASWRYWFVRGYLDEGHEWLERALELDARPDSRTPDRLALRAKTLNAAGNLGRVRGDLARAGAYHAECLALREQVGDTRGVAASLNNMATVASQEGDLQRAAGLFERSLQTYRELGDRWATALLLNNLAVAARDQADLDRAEKWNLESLELRRRIGDLEGTAVSLRNLGELMRERGELERAEPYLLESLAIFRGIVHWHGIGVVLTELGLVAGARADWTRSVQLLSAADGLRQRTGAALEVGTLHQHELTVAAAHGALGAESLKRAWAHGERASVDGVLDGVLGMATRDSSRPPDDS